MSRAQQTRSRRPRRPDRITNPDGMASKAEAAIYHALRPLDRIAAEMEMKWGVDRLPMLVSAGTAAKFGSAAAKLDAAIDARDEADVTKRAEVMLRAWIALDQEADNMGHSPLQLDVWTWRDEETGRAFSLVRDKAQARQLIGMGDVGGDIYALEEMCRIVMAFDAENVVGAVKASFEGATVSDASQSDFEEATGDEVPF